MGEGFPGPLMMAPIGCRSTQEDGSSSEDELDGEGGSRVGRSYQAEVPEGPLPPPTAEQIKAERAMIGPQVPVLPSSAAVS